MTLDPAFDPGLLSRCEDAGLNASAPPQQRWLDGWLVRLSPGKAKRARCINAVARGRLPLADKLELCRTLYRAAGLPLYVRITPFSEPPALDRELEGVGMQAEDDTRVMIRPSLQGLSRDAVARAVRFDRLGHHAFAEMVGRFRGSPLAQREAHAQRLQEAPVPFEAFALFDADDVPLACGQIATEAELVGLYDVYTADACRGRGFARHLCALMLEHARARGASIAYLQVDAANAPARRVYERLGFTDAYAYHYRTPTASASPSPG
jgi:ribosomal protein S18 acetylase RimI-like enzyme